MIRYALRCPVEHEFEAWFPSSGDFDNQVAQGLVECPMCGSTAITKAIMAPRVHTSKGEEPLAEAQKLSELMHRVRRHVENTHDYVGASFAAEARDMHEGARPERPIYGEATPDEVKALVEDGVPIAPLPVFNLPNADNATAKMPSLTPRVRRPGRRVN